MRNVRAVEQEEARRVARQRKNSNSRISRAALFTEANYDRCLTKAQEKIKEIVTSHNSIARKDEREKAAAALKEVGLIGKWCIDFLPGLMSWGGGQRPQVYAQLLCPTSAEQQELNCCLAKGKRGFVALRAQSEKTMRATDMPNVYFSDRAAPFICFLVEIIRNVIIDHIPNLDIEGVDDALVLDTRTGSSLTMHQMKLMFS